MKKKFKPIYHSPFGNTVLDERATHEAFEDYMGGATRAFRILWIYQNSYSTGNPISSGYYKNYKSKEEVFKVKAAREGFDKNEIDAFLSL